MRRGMYEETILSLAEALRDTAENELEIGVATETAKVHLLHAAASIERVFPFGEEEVHHFVSDLKLVADKIDRKLRS